MAARWRSPPDSMAAVMVRTLGKSDLIDQRPRARDRIALAVGDQRRQQHVFEHGATAAAEQ